MTLNCSILLNQEVIMKITNGVYLAGPMSGMTGTNMKEWRTKAVQLLEMAGVPCLDPTRRVPYHKQKHDDRGLEGNISRRIFKQDLSDIARCEILLVDGRDHPSAKAQGTACEIMFSHMKNKIIIIWKNPGDQLNPFFVAMATEVHDDLEEAVYAAISYGE